jgi:hypothetical protein
MPHIWKNRDIATETPEEPASSDSGDQEPKQANPANRIERPYPRRTLEQAYRVPTVIREKNGGNPWPADQIAGALNIKVKSSNLKYIIGSARDFGWIEATKNADVANSWALTSLGRKAVYPTSDLPYRGGRDPPIRKRVAGSHFGWRGAGI